ncbi:MAG: mobile mystery protein B [Candidatus Aminicenantes bacterium]|nr:mobile mystery protein B [Candidatus Aminicenantes bacterium]
MTESNTGATPIDPDEAKGLLLTHITTRGELDRWEQDNIIEALAWLYRTKLTDILNEHFIKTLHRRMFGNVWKWAGHFRQSDKNIGGPWHQVPTSVRNLCDDTRLWIELQEESPDEMAVHFHHRLVSIHPFANGNGRHARLMTDILLENILKRPRFTWGSEDLSKSSVIRHKYISALQAADENNYEPLKEFVRT